MGACHRFAGGFAGAQPRLAKIAQYIAIFRLIAVAPYLNLLSVRRGWAIGRPVIVDETVEVRGCLPPLSHPLPVFQWRAAFLQLKALGKMADARKSQSAGNVCNGAVGGFQQIL